EVSSSVDAPPFEPARGRDVWWRENFLDVGLFGSKVEFLQRSHDRSVNLRDRSVRVSVRATFRLGDDMVGQAQCLQFMGGEAKLVRNRFEVVTAQDAGCPFRSDDRKGPMFRNEEDVARRKRKRTATAAL